MKKFLLVLMGVALMAGSAVAQQYQEVVYLKNGSVIRGVITEQIPNESLKIQTADGSVFAYSMSEVEKITKEEVSLVRTKRVAGLSNQFDGSYHRLYASYSPVSVHVDEGGSLDLTGLSLGWTMGVRMMETHPLYMEFGAGMLYAFDTEKEYGTKTKYRLLSLNIPVVATWQFEAAPTIHVAPYLGLNMRANIYGKTVEDSYGYEDKMDWFKSSEGDGDRFNVGLTFGANVTFNKFVLGLGYTTDFTEIVEEHKVNYFTISAGFCF